MTEGVPQFRLVYKGTTVKAIAPLTVRIELAKPGKEDMLSLFSLPIMPEKFWKNHKLSDPLSTPPLASGPYRITQWKMGQYIVYSRVKTTGRLICRSIVDVLTSTLSATITTLMTMSLSRRLKRAHLIYGWKTTLKNWATRYIGKISIIITSLKKSRKTSRRRTHAGWPLIFSARYLKTGGYVKLSPRPSILSG